jgi:hypothetical protein
MEHFIRASFKMIIIMDMVLYALLMEILMMVNGLMERKMGLVLGKILKDIVI